MLTPEELTTLRGATIEAAEVDPSGGLRMQITMSKGSRAIVLLSADDGGLSMTDETES